WAKAEQEMQTCTNLDRLRVLEQACGPITGSDVLVRVRKAMAAVVALEDEIEKDKMRALLRDCAFLTECFLVDNTKSRLKAEEEVIALMAENQFDFVHLERLFKVGSHLFHYWLS